MNKTIKISILSLVFSLILGFTAFADVAPEYKGSKKESNGNNEVQRTYNQIYDSQRNTVSNFQFYTSNYGIFALDIVRNIGGGFWPRGSANQYLFGGGVWFAAKKIKPGQTHPDSTKKLVEVSYNPNSGSSWFVPGRIDDGDQLVEGDPLKYRTVFSTDFKSDASPINSADNYKWPIWDIKGSNDTLKANRYFGSYVNDDGLRNMNSYPKGPAFISGEDIFATYKDTDLRRYEGGPQKNKAEGYPMRLQVEQTIYSWGFGDYRDFIFISYNITNRSSDLLKECWLAPVMDADISISTNASSGAGNDRVRFYDDDPDLNLATQWSNGDRGERNRGFGYLGFDFLESPSVDANGFPRKDKKVFETNEQLGLVTFRNWPIAEDLKESEERYNFISSKRRDGESSAGDQRFMMATGPFNMNPGDTVRVVVGIILANTAKGADADGTKEDMAELVRKDKFAQAVYDNNFRAPTPPNKSIIVKATPLNHGVIIQWDETAERGIDQEENGLDFLGYKLYRARRPDLDTFDLAQSIDKGPFGWKQIFSVELTKPYWKSYLQGGTDGHWSNPYIDSLAILGPYIDKTGKVLDTMAIRIMKIPYGVRVLPMSTSFAQTGTAKPFIYTVDTAAYSKPWGPVYKKMLQEDGVDLTSGAITWDINRNLKLFDDVAVGVAYLDKALINANPLFFRKGTIEFSQQNLDTLLKYFPDGIKGKTNTYYDSVKKEYVTVRITTDTIFTLSSFKRATIGGKQSYVIDVLTQRPVSQMMNDTTHVKSVLESLYSFIKLNLVKLEFPNWENSPRAINDCIVPFMKENTDNRTFVDIGDDNKDGFIAKDLDPTKSEELVNNINYFYAVIAYDEGDYILQTKTKQNEASGSAVIITERSSNVIAVKPSAGKVSGDAEFEVVISPQDSLMLGGLYNFRMYSVDKDRLLKNFAGHDLELTFTPYWSQQTINLKGTTNETDQTKFGLYQRRAVLKDLMTNNILFDALLSFEKQPCSVPYRGAFTENAASFIFADSVVVDSVSGKEIRFGLKNNDEIRTFAGTFSTGSFRSADPAYCYTLATQSPAYGALGFGFDFGMEQWGGWYRPDSTTIQTAKAPGEDAMTAINYLDETKTVRTFENIQVTQPIGVDYSVGSAYTVAGSFNNGPGIYEVEFTPGGEEDMEVNWGGQPPKNTNVATFKVKYLNVKIKNLIKFNRPSELSSDSVTVRYPADILPMELPLQGVTTGFTTEFPERFYPDPRNLGYGGVDRLNPRTNEFIGKFNMSVYGWVDARGGNYNNNLNVPKQMARPNIEPYKSALVTYLNRQNRYYLSGTSLDGTHTIDFTHNLNIGGVQFALDYANKGRFNTTSKQWEYIPVDQYIHGGPDFAVGDKITLRIKGGALGMPLPNAKVIFKVNTPEGANGVYTDKLMDGIKVVPNPYFISHQGQRSPYETDKIFFTKLPEECKIEIYTIAGDLIKTIEHKDMAGNIENKEYAEVWDLLSTNGIRAQSQALIAVITTPDGKQTVKNFSIVVGGFRLIPD